MGLLRQERRRKHILGFELILLQCSGQFRRFRLHRGGDADLRQPEGDKVQLEAKHILIPAFCGEGQMCSPFGKHLISLNFLPFRSGLVFVQANPVAHPADTRPDLPVSVTGRHEFCAQEGHLLDFQFVHVVSFPVAGSSPRRSSSTVQL